MIILAGMIGVGKTTYSSLLAKELGTTAFLETVDNNPILSQYYHNPKKYAFALQIYFLNKRFQTTKKARCGNNNILDRSIYEDALFTYINTLQGTISKQEYDIYLELLDNLTTAMNEPSFQEKDLLIYLEGSFQHIMDNIKKRRRIFEQPNHDNHLIDYYKLLHKHYNTWYDNYQHSPKMKINTNHIDVTKAEDWQEVYQNIQQKMKSLKMIE